MGRSGAIYQKQAEIIVTRFGMPHLGPRPLTASSELQKGFVRQARSVIKRWPLLDKVPFDNSIHNPNSLILCVIIGVEYALKRRQQYANATHTEKSFPTKSNPFYQQR